MAYLVRLLSFKMSQMSWNNKKSRPLLFIFLKIHCFWIVLKSCYLLMKSSIKVFLSISVCLVSLSVPVSLSVYIPLCLRLSVRPVSLSITVSVSVCLPLWVFMSVPSESLPRSLSPLSLPSQSLPLGPPLSSPQPHLSPLRSLSDPSLSPQSPSYQSLSPHSLFPPRPSISISLLCASISMSSFSQSHSISLLYLSVCLSVPCICPTPCPYLRLFISSLYLSAPPALLCLSSCMCGVSLLSLCMSVFLSLSACLHPSVSVCPSVRVCLSVRPFSLSISASYKLQYNTYL